MAVTGTRRVLVIFAVATGCCPPPVVRSYVPPSAPRNLPAPIVSRFEKPAPPQAQTPKPPVNREMMTEPPVALPGPKVEEAPARQPLAPPPPPPPADTLPDEIVMRLLDTGRAAFVRCFKKAIAADPTELSFKVRVHVELDENAVITAARTDATNPTLNTCLVRSVGWLKFPATGRRVAVDLPLFYRGE